MQMVDIVKFSLQIRKLEQHNNRQNQRVLFFVKKVIVCFISCVHEHKSRRINASFN